MNEINRKKYNTIQILSSRNIIEVYYYAVESTDCYNNEKRLTNYCFVSSNENKRMKGPTNDTFPASCKDNILKDTNKNINSCIISEDIIFKNSC